MKLKNIYPFIILCIGISFSSCITHPELVVFHKENPLPDSIPARPLKPIEEIRIQKGDVISIAVNTFNQSLAAPFNQDQASLGGGNLQNLIGYLVNTQGKISFPVIGDLTVENLSVKQIELFNTFRSNENTSLFK